MRVTANDLNRFKISTQLLMKAAFKRGYEVEYFWSSPTRGGITRCQKDGQHFFFRSTMGVTTSSLGVFAAENKALMNSLLIKDGIQTPEICVLNVEGEIDYQSANQFLAKYGKVVVKPVDTNHGDGITVNITSEQRLKDAIDYAKQHCLSMDVIVQRQVEGKEYRFLVVDGRVLAVANRIAPWVEGDGQSTIEELIKLKNQDPRRGHGHESPMTLIDPDDVRQHLGQERLSEVLAVGQRIDLLGTSNLSRGGESIDLTDTTSRQLKDLAVRAAQSCFLGIAGVDIITDDITTTDLSHSYILEVNLTPGIRMHQFPGHGQPRDVASAIFDIFAAGAYREGVRISHVGQAEEVALPELGVDHVHARVDSGARTSSLWASDIKETPEGLSYKLFGPGHPLYSGQDQLATDYSTRVVMSSMGEVQNRYMIKTKIRLKGRLINAKFTLADRSNQAYAVLVGRNVLRGKFIVDVSKGSIDRQGEARAQEIKNQGA